VEGTLSHSPRQEHSYINTGRTCKLEGAEEVSHGALPLQLRMLRKQPKLKGTARELKAATNFVRLFRDLKMLVSERTLRRRTCLQIIPPNIY
jgi:hypothetical protein